MSRVMTVGAAVALTVVLGGWAAAPGAAQEPSPSTTTTIVASHDLPGVIPRPNQGRAPQQAGDPGGWLQLTLAGLLVVALVVIFTVVARSTIRSTRAKRVD